MQMKEPTDKDERYRIDVTPLEYKIYEEVHKKAEEGYTPLICLFCQEEISCYLKKNFKGICN